jgi:hypothetical protein
MIKIDLINRIELIEAQIENVKHSGHFTEKKSTNIYPLEMELESLKTQFDVFGMTYDQYVEGKEGTRTLFSQMKLFLLLW